MNSLADQLRDLRRLYEEECRRKKNAEDKVNQLTANNGSLQAKIDELLQFSGSHSDMLAKLNEEMASKQKEHQRRESELQSEIETLHRQAEAKESEIRNFKVRNRNCFRSSNNFFSIRSILKISNLQSRDSRKRNVMWKN